LPTQDEADAIVAAIKVITQNVVWRQVRSRFRNYRIEANVLIPERDELARLAGHVGKTNFNFSLLYGNEPIRRCHKGFEHRNPDGSKVTGIHKHIWDDEEEDRWAYEPESFPDDPNRAFLEFLDECNIELRGNYQPFLG